MQTLILNGSLPGQDELEPIQRILEETLADSKANVESVILHESDIRTCIGCFRCWGTTPGECFQKDDAPEIVKKVIRSDLVVFLTPLTFGGYSSELKKIIERMLGLLQPGMLIYKGETHHFKRYERYPSVLAIALTESKDEEAIRIFKKLGERHSLNFYPPHHAAEVFIVGENEDEWRGIIKEFLAEMEIDS